jgi:hypothetical protein
VFRDAENGDYKLLLAAALTIIRLGSSICILFSFYVNSLCRERDFAARRQRHAGSVVESVGE